MHSKRKLKSAGNGLMFNIKFGISNKILSMALLILILFTVALSVMIGMTSFNNLTMVTMDELERMSNILTRNISGLEKNAVQIVKSFEKNDTVTKHVTQLTNLGPYFASDQSLIGQPIEDSEIIYSFQSQLELIQILQPLQLLNKLSAISFYLTSPFDMIADSRPVLAVRLDAKAIYATQFATKGKVDDRIIQHLQARKLKPPSPDYFDISSVYSLPPEKFYRDNNFQPIEKNFGHDFYTGSWKSMVPPSTQVKVKVEAQAFSQLIETKDSLMILTVYPVKAQVADPDTFQNRQTPVGLIVTEQKLDKPRLVELKHELGIDVGLAYNNELTVTSIDGVNKRIPLEDPETVSINNKMYYYSQKPVFLSDNVITGIQAVALSPISTLAELNQKLSLQIIYLSAIMMLLTGVITYLSVRRLIKKPLHKLLLGVQHVAEGNLSHRVHIDSSDELGLLAGTFNEMADKLKTTGDALQDSYNDLEKRVEERTLELQETNKDLVEAKIAADAATEAKSEFLANMSHEIHTPMNGILASADLALAEESFDKVKKYLQMIHRSGYSLLGIINDILDFSKIEAGKLDLELRPFRLDEVLDNLAGMFSYKALEKKIELLVDVDSNIPKALVGDALRVQQILTNLVGNAVKFTPQGGVISVGITGEEVSETLAFLKFSVKDTGLGMNPEQLSKMFQPFSQADASTTRKFGRTGLGLCISKQLTELMGGKIWVESEFHVGSRFSFNAKFERQDQEQEEKLVIPHDLENLHVLVVDDTGAS